MIKTDGSELNEIFCEGGTSLAYVLGPFDISKKTLELRSYKIITLEEMAELRIKSGAKGPASLLNSSVKEGTVYVSGRGLFLTKSSPIMDSPEKAVRGGDDFKWATKEQIESALGNSIKIQNQSKGQDYGTGIPFERLGENQITNFMFGKHAQNYGDFLKENVKDKYIRKRGFLLPYVNTSAQYQLTGKGLFGLELVKPDCLIGQIEFLGINHPLTGIHSHAHLTSRFVMGIKNLDSK